MTRTASPRDQATSTDGRDGRVVGKDDDNALESLGKAIVAPIEGADEDADTAPERPFTNLTGTLPQGEEATEDPTLTQDKREHR